MLDLSILILARNEEDRLGDCLKSCAFADEILVIDDGSTDGTASLAQSFGARVIHHAMQGDWGQQQTFAIRQAKHKWVFFIDADERISGELRAEIERCVSADEDFCYWVQRKNTFEGANHGVMCPDWVPRLMPASGSEVRGKVHPEFVSVYTKRKLRGKLIHFPYRCWENREQKMRLYSTLAAEKMKSSGRRSYGLFDVLIRPMVAFVKVYVLKLGFLDGQVGFVLSADHAHYTMMKYQKLASVLRRDNQ